MRCTRYIILRFASIDECPYVRASQERYMLYFSYLKNITGIKASRTVVYLA